jgi:DNA-binding transcriptional MerR regulator
MSDSASIKAPDAFRTISEVAEDLDLPQHVLRFWETRFNQIKPLKRGGGRRYYRPEDVDLLRGIRLLLYAEGFTIRGVQRLLKEKGVGFVSGVGQSGSVQTVTAAQRGRAEPPPPRVDLSIAPPAEDFLEAAPEPHETDERLYAAGPAPARVVGLTQDSRRRLEGVVSDLIEARRLLDQAFVSRQD